jgi:predicted phosphodiesterase
MKMQEIQLAPGPVLVFGGPYSNLAATRAMRALAESKEIPPCNCICTGDTVAYCGRPMDTVTLLRDWNIPVILGNCEESLAHDAEDCGCGYEAGSMCSTLSQQWYRFSSQHINADTREWMKQLPRAIEFQIGHHRVRVVHGSVHRINQFIFPSTGETEKLAQFNGLDVNIIIGGHSGLPFGESLGNVWWLNSGAIGMPANDGTPDGWYLLLEPDTTQLHASWHRLHYDFMSEHQAMKSLGLDNGYADALLSGLWPSIDVLPQAERDLRGQPLQPESLCID